VFVHELAHSYIAKRNSLSISKIVLFIFGEVPQIGEEAPIPKVEFKVSLVGPATNLVIAGLLGSAYWAAKGTSVEPAYFASPEYGALVNLLLGCFDMIPALALDGGRVFRATLWHPSKSLPSATETASKVGVASASLFIFGGLAFLFTGFFVNGIWFVFIGLFLKNGAEASLRQTILTDTLRGVLVEDIMTRNVDTIEADTSLADLVQNCFARYKHGGHPILEDGGLLSILTLQDLGCSAREHGEAKDSRGTHIQQERLRTSQQASKYLVTIGACATAAGIQALPNFKDSGAIQTELPRCLTDDIRNPKTCDPVPAQDLLDLQPILCPYLLGPIVRCAATHRGVSPARSSFVRSRT